MIDFRWRLGFGFDIEDSWNILHEVSDTPDGERYVVAFGGTLVKLPFCTIYIGKFVPHPYIYVDQSESKEYE